MTHIEKLPIILLKYLLGVLDNNNENILEIIDCICFSLTCKKFFNERDHYLSFNTKQLLVKKDTYLIKQNSEFHFASFTKSFLRALEKKQEYSQCSESIVDIKQGVIKDANFDFNKDLNDNEIPKISKSVCKLSYHIDYLRAADSQYKTLPDLSDTNITEMKLNLYTFNGIMPKDRPNFIKNGFLPKNLTNLNLSFPIEDTFTVGLFPQTLKHLSIDSYKQPFLPGVLPSQLESLTLRSYSHPLTVGILPSSLLKFHLLAFSERIEPGALGNKLEEFTHNSYDTTYEIDTNILPTSLRKLSCGFNSPPNLSHLVNLTIILKFPYNYIQHLPTNIRHVEIISNSNLNVSQSSPLLMSSLQGITYLDLGACGQLLDLKPGCLPTTIEKLNLGFYKQILVPGVIPSGTKRLYLGSNFNQELSVNLFPDTIEKLSLTYNYNHPIKANSLPNSIKSLTLYRYRYHLTRILPKFLESLCIITDGYTRIQSQVLPPTLSKLNVRETEISIDAVYEPDEETMNYQIFNNKPMYEGLSIIADSTFLNVNRFDKLPFNVQTVTIKESNPVTFRKINENTFIFSLSVGSRGGFIEADSITDCVEFLEWC